MASPTHEEIENEGNGLASNVLGLFESSIMGIAGSAPAYSIAATTVTCLLYTSPSPRDRTRSRMPSSA